MSSADKNLDLHSDRNLINLEKHKLGIVVSEWNEEVTDKLKEGALEALREYGAKNENIRVIQVPGSYELTLGAQWLAEMAAVEAVICLGCVIQGETRHFDFICSAVAQGIMDLNIKSDKPIIFGVLTTENQQQALDRAGGAHGNKGYEAGITAIKMLGVKAGL